MSFEEAGKYKIAARERKIAYLNSLTEEEKKALDLKGQAYLKKIAEGFQGYES